MDGWTVTHLKTWQLYILPCFMLIYLRFDKSLVNLELACCVANVASYCNYTGRMDPVLAL